MKRKLLVVAGLAGVASVSALAFSRPQATPDMPHGELSIDCASCHTAEAWSPLASPLPFDHAVTGFRLEGAHAGRGCRSCHQSLMFSHVGAACADCHADPHRGELGFRCEACHSASTWSNQRSLLERHARTLFPLLGQHANVDCDGCHRTQQPHEYAFTPLVCEGCHQRAFTEARNPDHVRAGFAGPCEDCHLTFARSWSQTSYTHPASYPLEGAHAGAPCEGCHAQSFAGTPQDCAACHLADYDAARNPDHRAAGLPTTCDSCHSTRGWSPASGIDHDLTRFPLTGAHRGADCGACHGDGRFTGTPTECLACHRSDYDQTRDPSHAAAGFPTSCEGCHSTDAWRPASNIDHDLTRFPLTGAHRGADCGACHGDGRFAGTPTECVACHRSDYDQTRHPNHAASGFPTSCEGCHSTDAWRPASNIDHDLTRFPLTGAHRGVDCGACHQGGRFAGTPTECVACHRSDYDGTRDPNHAASGFPTSCEGCHSTDAWRPASNINHDLTRFPLTGAHRGVDCGACHQGGRFAGTPRDCVACHRRDYDQTRDPNHAAAGFPTTCAACHSTGGWRPASFDHDRYFPIYSGPHDGVWSDCQTCHTSAGNFGAFSCTNCHEHSRSRMDDKHDDVNGYSYDSQACYRCHPRGRADD
jgi:hypothetical protein